MNSNPIGIFDSGIGGTSIWKEINTLLPNENTIYLADSKNAPYGVKSQEEILQLSIKNTELLLSEGCKIIVVACNTATTNAINYLRKNYNVPFIGIEPAIKPAALQSQSKKIGVLATKGTLSSSLFQNTSVIHADGIVILEQEGTGLVSLIEQGEVASEHTKTLLKSYLEPMLQAGIDCLVLGCTHYPYLIPVLKEILPKHVKIIASGEAVAKQTKSILKQHNLENTSKENRILQFYTNAEVVVLESFLSTTNVSVKTNYLDF